VSPAVSFAVLIEEEEEEEEEVSIDFNWDGIIRTIWDGIPATNFNHSWTNWEAFKLLRREKENRNWRYSETYWGLEENGSYLAVFIESKALSNFSCLQYQYMEDESSVAGRSSYVSKLRGYSSDIIRVQRDVDHASLMEATFLQTNEFIDEFQLRDVEQRTRLLSSSNILDEGSKRLVNANRIALETEDIGANVLSELSSQKQTILRARDNLDLIEDNISRSRRILLKMSRRIATDKFVLMGIILLLLLVISLIVYFKWLRHLI